jgi:hypothetical protein
LRQFNAKQNQFNWQREQRYTKHVGMQVAPRPVALGADGLRAAAERG